MNLDNLGSNPKNKKNEKDESKAHILTKEELIADFKIRRNCFGRRLSDEEIEDEVKKTMDSESDKQEKIAEDEDEIISQPATFLQPPSEKKENVLAEVTEKKLDIDENDLDKQPDYSAIIAPIFKLEESATDDAEKNIKEEPQSKIEKNKIEKNLPDLDKSHEKILNLFIAAVKSGDEQQLRKAVEEIAQLRTDDEYECQPDAPLNVAIKHEIFKSISSILAYKGSKEIIRIFQLIDLLNLEIKTDDFSVISDEIVHSQEMHNIAVKYLIWCAKEYEEYPAEFEKRVFCFANTGILTFTEVHELPELQNVISRSIVEYAKNNLKKPLDIERKIYQYSLTGFLNGKALKKSEKIKNLARGYLIETMEKYQDRPEEIENRIKEYERAGFIERQDLREDEKIQKMLERQLARYIKENKKHPRKISIRIREYFKMGLIEKKTMEGYLKQL